MKKNEKPFYWFLLEYNEETATWHHNRVKLGVPHDKPNTHGWISIAYTHEDKAYLFTNTIDCRNEWRKEKGMPPLDAKEVMREWALFCFQINSMLINSPFVLSEIESIRKSFNPTLALARLGHPAFCNQPEFKDEPRAWDYDPFSVPDSNFYKIFMD